MKEFCADPMRPSYRTVARPMVPDLVRAGKLEWSYDAGGRTAMSEYVFYCEDCNKEFTRSLHMAERERGPVACPYCKGENVHQVVTAFSAVTSKKS